MAHVTHTKLGTKVEYHSKEEDAKHGKRRLKVCDSLPSPPVHKNDEERQMPQSAID